MIGSPTVYSDYFITSVPLARQKTANPTVMDTFGCVETETILLLMFVVATLFLLLKMAAKIEAYGDSIKRYQIGSYGDSIKRYKDRECDLFPLIERQNPAANAAEVAQSRMQVVPPAGRRRISSIRLMDTPSGQLMWIKSCASAFGQDSLQSHRSSHRFVILLFVLLIFWFLQYFTSFISTDLTVSAPEKVIDSLDDLHQSGLQPILLRGMNVENVLKLSNLK